MFIWYFSNNLDICEYVGKLPEQHFSVLLFSNPGDKISFLLKFYEARISEWNLMEAFQNFKKRSKFILFFQNCPHTPPSSCPPKVNNLVFKLESFLKTIKLCNFKYFTTIAKNYFSSFNYIYSIKISI